MDKSQTDLHTCWIGNITADFTEEQLNLFFTQQAKNLAEEYHSVKIKFSEKHKIYQCFINFLTEQDALKAAEHFDGSKLKGLEMTAKYRNSNLDQKFSSESRNTSCNKTDRSLSTRRQNQSQSKCDTIPKEKPAEKRSDYFSFLTSDTDSSINIRNNNILPSRQLASQKQAFNQRQYNKLEASSASLSSFNNDIDDNGDNDDYDEFSSDDGEHSSVISEASVATNEKQTLSKTIIIHKSKYFEKLVYKKLNDLKVSFKQVVVESRSENTNIDLIFVVKALHKDFDQFERVVGELKKIEIIYKYHVLTKSEFDQIKSKRNDLIKNTSGKSDNFHIQLNVRNNQIVLFAFIDSGNDDEGKKFMEKIFENIFEDIKKYCNKNIDITRVIEIHDENQFDCLFKYLNKKLSDSNSKQMQNVKIEFKKSLADKNLTGKLVLTGKKFHASALNIDQLIQVFSQKKDSKIGKASSIPFIKFKLNFLKDKLDRENYCLLKFEVDNKKVSFSLTGFDQQITEKYTNIIEHLVINAKSVWIPIEDVKLGKKVFAEYKGNKKEDESDDVDIYFNEESKILFINGTDQEELDQMREYFFNLLKGSKVINKTIRYDKLIYEKLVYEKGQFFQILRSKFPTIKIFSRPNEERIIRLIGEVQKLNEALKMLNDLSITISNDIITESFELKKSEYIFLSNDQKHEISNIEKKFKTLIQIDDNFVKYASLRIPTVSNLEIELLSGDYVRLNVDAYVNPANRDLNHAGGLAKEICDKAENRLQNDCIQFIKTNGQLSEGDVYVTECGNLGLKKSSCIIHAVGPIWKGGVNNEESSLSKCIRLSLISASERNCQSIAIPPVSTGIFNYPVEQALKIISKTAIDWAISTGSSLSLKKIIFISNIESIAEQWEEVLNFISIEKSLSIKTNSKAKSTNSTRWYWKDDQNLWKAFRLDQSHFIEQKFLNNEFRFEHTIDKKLYEFDLRAKTQKNKSTGYLHEINNELPDVPKYEWSWLDDSKSKSPYSIEHSRAIENSFERRETQYVLNIKRHDNDKENLYHIRYFARNQNLQQKFANEPNAFGAIAVQINVPTNYVRFVFRRVLVEKDKIKYDEEDKIEEKNRTNVLFVSGFSENVESTKQSIQDLIKSSYNTEKLPLFDLSTDQINDLKLKFDSEISLDSHYITIHGLKNNLDKIKSEILLLGIGNSKIKYPENWTEMQHEQLKLVPLGKNSKEYLNVFEAILKSIPQFEIIRIERIQNKWLWKLYQKQIECLKDKNVNENEAMLFHGTSSTSPEFIYDGETGFDMRFSNQGMWGRGIYFAVNAAYSKSGYAFKNPDGISHCLFYSRVALGDYKQVPSNRSLILPPEKPQSGATKKFSVMRYDSIKGNTNGSDLFILYENNRAYPEYLITFKN